MSAVSASGDRVAAGLVGVGIDTARYGHYVSFLVADSAEGPPRRAMKGFSFAESRAGYLKLQDALQRLATLHPGAEIFVRLDLAGRYGVNLECFLRGLALPLKLSAGDPLRNRSYQTAISPKNKSDAADSYCVARFAAVERPAAVEAVPEKMIQLREIASQLLAITKVQTMHANQLHNLLSRVFPELTVAYPRLRAPWMLGLLNRWPTPKLLARAASQAVLQTPYITREKAEMLQTLAADSIGSFSGPVAAQLVRQLVGALRRDAVRKRSLEKLLVQLYRRLPDNHLATIPGVGETTAAVLTAKIVSIDRFSSPAKLVSYFGVFPETRQSGSNPDGTPNKGSKTGMSRKGSDLVRAYLYSCACSAARNNPACRALYARKKAKGACGNVALGHVMRKLLHLAYAVWKTDRPFDPRHFAWEQPKETDVASRTTDQSLTSSSRQTTPDKS